MKYTKIYCTCPEAIDHQTMWWRTLGGHSSSNLTPLCDSISIFNKIKSACSHPSPGTVLLLFLINSCCCSLQSGGRRWETGGSLCVLSSVSKPPISSPLSQPVGDTRVFTYTRLQRSPLSTYSTPCPGVWRGRRNTERQDVIPDVRLLLVQHQEENLLQHDCV